MTDNKKTDKKNYSNRFLKKKIDILFDNTQNKNISKKEDDKEKVKVTKNSQSKPTKPNRQPIAIGKKNIFLALVLLLILIATVSFFKYLNSSHFDFVYWFKTLFAGEQYIEEVYINKKYFIKSHAPIYSTPAIADVNDDSRLDFVFGNTLGDVYAIDGATGKKIYHFDSGGSILASVNFVQLEKQKAPAAIVANNKGDFFVLNSQGDYFYDIRKEFIHGAINTKPVVNPNNKDIYLATEKGVVVCLESNYGFVKWKNEVALEKDSVFAPPLLVDLNQDRHLDVVVASLSGNVCALNGKDGTVLWINKLFVRVKSSPLVMSFSEGHVFSNNKLLLITSTTGDLFLLNSKNGKKIKVKKISPLGTIVSTPAQVAYSKNHLLFFTTQEGQFIILVLTEEGDFKTILKKRMGNCYFTSPIVCDLDRDDLFEIILVSREGVVDILSTKNKYQRIATSFHLDYNVTATPLLADLNGDRQLELVCSGEEGTVTVLKFTTKPKTISPKNTILYGEFLNQH